MTEPSTEKSLQIDSGSTAADFGSHTPQKQTAYRYKIGLIGSTASGKTCLLSALYVTRRSNPRGYNASMFPLKDANGGIALAVKRLSDGNWPLPTPPEDHHLAGHFTDGKLLEKYVELFDYSGELLDPDVSDGDLAKRLRAMLREMDGLLVLAEHPFSISDTFELSKELSGLMQVIGLLQAERRDNPDAAARTVPIAMLITKWDRSPHFDPSLGAEGQECILNEKFLNAEPEPYHRAVANVLRPASDNRFKVFPVSAICPLRRVKHGNGDIELPPVGEPFQSVGLEDPFIWVIEQRDEIDAAEVRQDLEATTLQTSPWTAYCNAHRAAGLKRRFKAAAPEGVRIEPLHRKAWVLFIRQTCLSLLLILSCFAIVETAWDFKQHHVAFGQVNNPTGAWEKGAAWFRDFGQSSVIRHFVYSRVVLSKQAALQEALRIEKEKDNASFEILMKATKDNKLDQAEPLATEQNNRFPNSSHQSERDQILKQIADLRKQAAFQKALSQWEEKIEPLRPGDRDEKSVLETKQNGLTGLVGEIRKSDYVPLAGVLRDRYYKLLSDCDDLLKKLAAEIAVRTTGDAWLRDYQQAVGGQEYAKAARLFARADFKKVSDGALILRQFRESLTVWVTARCTDLSQKGQSWNAAKVEAKAFNDPEIRDVIGKENFSEIQSLIQEIEKQGDVFLYDLVTKNLDTSSMEKYLKEAPIKSMAPDVKTYEQWLEKRQEPKSITFRLVKITWGQNLERGWFDRSVIKLYVNGCCDARTEQPDDNNRSGSTDDAQGYRMVTVPGIKQVQTLELSFQLWDKGNISGKMVERLTCNRQITAESLAEARGIIVDRGGTMLEITVDPVVSKPSLPPVWHPLQ